MHNFNSKAQASYNTTIVFWTIFQNTKQKHSWLKVHKVNNKCAAFALKSMD